MEERWRGRKKWVGGEGERKKERKKERAMGERLIFLDNIASVAEMENHLFVHLTYVS